MGLSYYEVRQIIIKVLAYHKMLPNLYSTCANTTQKVTEIALNTWLMNVQGEISTAPQRNTTSLPSQPNNAWGKIANYYYLFCNLEKCLYWFPAKPPPHCSCYPANC